MDFSKQIEWLRGLDYNWNGHGGVPPSEHIVDNVVRFHDLMNGAGFGDLAGTAYLYPSHGHVLVRHGWRSDYVDVQIGRNYVSWFLCGDGWGGENGVPPFRAVCDFETLPEGLMEAMGNLT